MAETLVNARGVSKTYNIPGRQAVEVLHDASCSIEIGDRIALVGSSGSGKSTLLNILGGLESPTSGEIDWPGLGRRSELQPLKIAFVFQSPSLFPPLTVIQNVALPLVLAGRLMQTTERAQRLLLQLGLADLSNKLPEELSGGQAQRVAMARALIVRPKLLIADEPTGQLDTRTSMAFLDIVLDHLEETQSALVVATHDGKVAQRMRQRWTMQHGRLSSRAEEWA